MPLREFTREEAAAAMSRNVPLAHFPARERFAAVIAGWGRLVSPASRGVPPRDGSAAAALRCDHVFAYAGPCCYADADAVGTTALFFQSSTLDGRAGHATPFDTGALVEPNPRLEPWASRLRDGSMTNDEALAIVEQESRVLEVFRAELEAWLLHAYDDPHRYLDTSDDPFGDGVPDRLTPQDLRDQNGRHALDAFPACADRRAWTWEVRTPDPISYDDAIRVLTTRATLEAAIEAFADLAPRVIAADGDGLFEGAATIYRASGRVVTEIVEDAA